MYNIISESENDMKLYNVAIFSHHTGGVTQSQHYTRDAKTALILAFEEKGIKLEDQPLDQLHDLIVDMGMVADVAVLSS